MGDIQVPEQFQGEELTGNHLTETVSEVLQEVKAAKEEYRVLLNKWTAGSLEPSESERFNELRKDLGEYDTKGEWNGSIYGPNGEVVKDKSQETQMDKVVEKVEEKIGNYEKITEDYYFTLFDMRNIDGKEILIEKRSITHTNKLQLMGGIGRSVTELNGKALEQDAEAEPVIQFYNKRRAIQLGLKINEWEGSKAG